MYRTLAVLLMLVPGVMTGQEPIVRKSALQVNTVKHGDLIQMVRGLGVLKAERTAEVKIASSMVQRVELGQTSVIDTGQRTVTGRVVRIHVGGADDMTLIEVALDSDPPQGVRPGQNVDGAIHVLTLKDVVYVGGPADELSALSERTGTMFKMEPDGQHAVRTHVEFGLTGWSTGETGYEKVIEIRSGLRPGNTVIMSDMSAFKDKERVRVQ